MTLQRTDDPRIFVADDVLPIARCDELIASAERNGWHNKGHVTHYETGVREVAPEYRDCDEIWLDDEPRMTSEFNALSELFWRAAQAYIAADARITENLGLEPMRFIRYAKRKGFVLHADQLHAIHGRMRQLTAVLYLNDPAPGGQLGFLHQNVIIEPKPGRMALFPVGPDYLHEAFPADSHKYIVAAWFDTLIAL